MGTIITSEDDMSNADGILPEGVVLVNFKMVGIGPNTLNGVNYVCKSICDITKKQTGFFLISDNGDGIREAMHELVDRFCDAQEGKNESKN